MTDYFKSSECMEVVVSRMIAMDGCTLRLFIESEDLRNMFKKSGFELPKSPNTIAKIVLTQAKELKEWTKNKILQLKQAGHRFSITLDEWTSLRNKRYMNINLHSTAFGGFNYKNLGMVKITGSMSALAALIILRDHLAKFNVSLDDDIVSATTDGASVMVKMGRYIKGHHQVCLAHGIQLAVIDTLYKTRKEPETENETVAPFQAPPSHPQDDSDSESDDNDNDDQAEANLSGNVEFETPAVPANPELYKEIISKVRRLVKSIRKSPLKADALRDYVLQEHKKDIQLQLDCRTRWSSMSDMIGVFLKLKNSVLKALIDWKSEISFSEDEIQTLSEIHNSLNVVRLAVLSICRRDATLHTADTTLKFLLKKLDEQNSALSFKLAMNLRSRIKQRRLLLAGVLHYLHDWEDFSTQDDDDTHTFPKPNGIDIADTITNLLQQLKYKPKDTDTIPVILSERSVLSSSSSSDAEVVVHELTLQEQLDKELEKCKKTPKNRSDFDLSGFIKVEQAMYESGGQRGVYLTEAYRYLMCVLPTSVESERAFSSAGYFCTKIRSTLSDEMLDALLFLRAHYQEQRSLKK
ncbi:unnamed protein product [Plutella xylostella]|uniref:(diamondback moth) hypothetical protein n=1 Tax=Plutella xylostella TaxID=51655 RepID=A0A8S4FNS6_PLUXY|nr:unnamed protein product [Plutella xylostella]